MITANIGRFGPYIRVEKSFISIKQLDPLTVTEEEANQKYEEYLSKSASREIKEFSGQLKVLNGPYGPYLTNGKKNVRLPKNIDPKDLTEAWAKELLAKKKTRYSHNKR